MQERLFSSEGLSASEVTHAVLSLRGMLSLAERDHRVHTEFWIEQGTVMHDKRFLSNLLPLNESLRASGLSHIRHEPLLATLIQDHDIALFGLLPREIIAHKHGAPSGDEQGGLVAFERGVYIHYIPYERFAMRLGTKLHGIDYHLVISCPVAKPCTYEEYLMPQLFKENFRE
jgi:hypothetical protein